MSYKCLFEGDNSVIIQRLGSCEKYVFYMMFIGDDIIVKAARDIVTGDIHLDTSFGIL